MMTTQPIDEPVHVTDNGIRSFLPPTFCFELRNSPGELVETVSRLRWPDLALADHAVLDELARRRAAAVGVVEEYDADPAARTPGKEFTVTGVVEDPPPP